VSEPTSARVIADTGGLVVTDDGRRLLVYDRCTGALTVMAVVLGIVTVVVGGFGAVALITGVPSMVLGAVFLAVGVALAAAVYLLVRKIGHHRGQPLHECRSVAVLDRKLGLFSYRGGPLIHIDHVRFARRFQISSSAAKLVAVTPGGTKVLKRGNPFDGGVGNVDQLLNAVVQEATHSPSG
jgi:hypothetical protein